MEELNKKNDIKKIYTKGRGKREEERKGEKARRRWAKTVLLAGQNDSKDRRARL